MISFNWGFSEGVPPASAPSPPFLSSSPSPPAGRRSCTSLRCEINYGPSPLSITEESALPRERRNNQKAFQSGGWTWDRRAHNAARGLAALLAGGFICKWRAASKLSLWVYLFIYFNVIIVSGVLIATCSPLPFQRGFLGDQPRCFFLGRAASRPSACPTSMLISPYGNESVPAGQLILKRSPGLGAQPSPLLAAAVPSHERGVSLP